MEEDESPNWTTKELGEAIRALSMVVKKHNEALERVISTLVSVGLFDNDVTKH